MDKSRKIGQMIFWVLLGLTIFIWVLRGVGLLTGISSGFIWVLIIATMGAGMVTAIQQTRRW